MASISTASVRPTPNSFMNEIPEVAKAMKTMASRAAAAVTIRPVCSSPVATDSVVPAPASCCSLMRDRRKTS